jgi:hypothetical protein
MQTKLGMLLSLILLSFSIKAQEVSIISSEATVVENGINVNLKVGTTTLSSYSSHQFTIDGNQIILWVCYDVSPFLMPDYHDNDFLIPTTENLVYQVQVSVFSRFGDFEPEDECDYNNPDGTITAVLSSNDFQNSNVTLSLFPNPTQGIIRIENKYEIIQRIHFYNVMGQLVKISNQVENDLSSLENGLYFAIIEIDNQKMTRKIVIQK